MLSGGSLNVLLLTPTAPVYEPTESASFKRANIVVVYWFHSDTIIVNRDAFTHPSILPYPICLKKKRHAMPCHAKLVTHKKREKKDAPIAIASLPIISLRHWQEDNKKTTEKETKKSGKRICKIEGYNRLNMLLPFSSSLFSSSLLLTIIFLLSSLVFREKDQRDNCQDAVHVRQNA